MSSHFGRLGKSLNNSVEAFNKVAGNIESRVLVTARRFRDLGAAPLGMEIEELPQVEQIARELQAPELLPAPENENGAQWNRMEKIYEQQDRIDHWSQ